MSITRRLRLTRRALGIALISALTLSFAAGGLAQLRVDTDVTSFLPASNPTMVQYQRLSRQFGGDPLVVLAESRTPHALLGPRELPKELGLEGKLSRIPNVSAVYGPGTTLNEIAGQVQDMLASLSGRQDGLQESAELQAKKRGESPAQVKQAGNAAVAQFDQRYGPLIVQGLPVGLPTLSNPKFVSNVLYRSNGQPRAQWQYLVPNSRAVAILVRPRPGLSQHGVQQLAGAVQRTVNGAGLSASRVTLSGVPALVNALGHEVISGIAVIGTIAVAAIGLVLLLIPWTSRRRRRLIPLAVTLLATALTLAVLGWIRHPLSLGVVAFLPVLTGAGSYYPTYFLSRARSRLVAVLAAGTVVSFATLALSPVPFVRDLGLTLAIGVCFSVGISWLTCRPSGVAPADGIPAAGAPPVPGRPLARAGAALAVVAVAAAGWVFLPSLALQANVQQLASGLPAMTAANHAENVIGSAAELDVVLTGRDVLTPQAWTWMNTAQQRIAARSGGQARPALSPPELLSFLGASPTRGQIQSGAGLLPAYLTRAMLGDHNRTALLAYGVRMDDIGRVRALISAVKDGLPAPPPGYHVEVTGLPAVAVQGYDLVSGSRYLGSSAGVIAAGIVLLAGLRGRRRDALRAVLAAALATGVELCALRLIGTALNPVSVALGSLTAAVGCEFTVLMAESARTGDRGLRRGVALAALISGVGYAVLVVSPLSIMRDFGVLLAVSTVLSYAAARFVVWAWPPARPARPADSIQVNDEQKVGVS